MLTYPDDCEDDYYNAEAKDGTYAQFGVSVDSHYTQLSCNTDVGDRKGICALKNESYDSTSAPDRKEYLQFPRTKRELLG